MASLRAGIGVVDQDPFLFSASIAENISLSATSARHREAARGPGGAAEEFIECAPRRL